MEVKGTAMARAFARGKLLFSQKLTAATVNAYLAAQRVATFRPIWVDFTQIWQSSSDFFDFLSLFDFQMSESKHFSPFQRARG